MRKEKFKNVTHPGSLEFHTKNCNEMNDAWKNSKTLRVEVKQTLVVLAWVRVVVTKVKL